MWCQGSARADPSRFQPLEPGTIDSFKRELKLKSRGRSGVDFTGGAQGAIALEVRPVTLEAERPSGLRPRATAKGRRFQRLAAGVTQRLWSFAFQLPSRKRNPFFCRRFPLLLCQD